MRLGKWVLIQSIQSVPYFLLQHDHFLNSDDEVPATGEFVR